MPDDDKPRKQLPPYLPFRTLDNYISELAETGIPAQIDRSVLQSKSGSMQSWLPNALRFLGLIDADGKPNQSLEQLVAHPSEERRECYNGLIGSAYKDLLSTVDTERGTQQQLEEWFRTQGMSATTASKSAAFFLDACKKAELPLSPHFNKKSLSASVGRRRRKTLSQPVDFRRNNTQELNNTKSASIPALQETLLQGLVERLPQPGDEFPRDKRERWIALARIVFDELYGAVDSGFA